MPLKEFRLQQNKDDKPCSACILPFPTMPRNIQNQHKLHSFTACFKCINQKNPGERFMVL